MARPPAIQMMLSISLALAIGCAVGGNEPGSSSAFEPMPTAPGTTSDSASTSDTGASATGQASVDGTGEPPPGGDCCTAAATPGCADADIQACVCTLDPACCQVAWSQSCADMAADPCGDEACEPLPGTDTNPPSDSSGDPMLSCDELAAMQGWMYWRCQAGDLQCHSMGTPTTDCDYCCEYCGEPGDVSCGDHATAQGWAGANCEWNGNGACGGQGTPTCDCDFCCEV